MAVTINQSPTLPNGTQADIIYTLSSTNATEPQFKYVCNIKSEGGTLLSQIKQSANESGFGVFEVSRLLDDHIGYDTPWLITGSTPIVSSTNSNIRSYEISFNEEYGTSPSSSVATGSAVSASIPSLTTFIPAVQERDAGSFNWQSGSYDALTNASNVNSTLNYNSSLNAQVVRESDYLTLSTLNGIARNGNLVSIVYNVYNANKTSVYNVTVNNSIVPTTTATKLLHVGVGPQNLASAGNLSIYFSNPTLYPYYSAQLFYTNGLTDKHFYQFECETYEGANFAFINKLGVFDYYRATLVNTEVESFNRKTFQAPYIDYSTTTSTIAYDYARRGETQYHNGINNTYTVETDWLTQEQADWLFELFESPSVYVQQGSNFVGVIITNANEAYKTNPKGQKVYKLTIQYRKSNSKKSRY